MRRLLKILALLSGVVIGAAVLRRRTHQPIDAGTGTSPSPAPATQSTPADAAEGDFLDQRPTDLTPPAVEGLTADPEVSEADALDQAHEVGGDLLDHDLTADAAVPEADAADQHTVVADE